jgi:penicillin G amidase
MSSPRSTVSSAFGRLGGLTSAAGYFVRRRPAEQMRGRLQLMGLSASVEVSRDGWGVPHIYAQGESDALFAQGFVHAQDRLWQMDFNRRLAAGRLSEVMGPVALPLDRWVRILGLRRIAEREEESLESDARELLGAYAAGVNARIEMGRFPVEFRLLGYEPDPWTPADSLSWAKMMAWWLSANWSAEIVRAQLASRLGAEQAAELEPLRPGDRRPALEAEGGDNDPTVSTAPEAPGIPFGGAVPGGSGSNNWVVSGTRTASGHPLLANDMHLAMTIPAVWYENHVVGGALEVAGVTFPGIPFVVAGHNRHVAWGFTAGFADVQDLYLERLRHTEDGRVEQECRGEWLPADLVRESITVKGGDAVTEEVVVTRHGPIINGLAPDYIGEAPLALRWTALEPEQMFRALRNMNQARSCQEFREALRDWGTPAQNVVYADTAGDIAYTLAGKVPVRARGDGTVPVPGWTDDHEWTGFVPYEELPHRHNPPQGFIATANDRVWGDAYPHLLGEDHCAGYRSRRIHELIEERERIDVGYVQGMQFDQVSLHARAIAGSLGGIETTDPEMRVVIERLRIWDGDLAAGSAEAAVVQEFRTTLTTLLLSGKLGTLASRYRGEGPVPVLSGLNLFGERAMEWLETTLADSGSHWFDLGDGRTRDDVLRTALREALDNLKSRLGPSVDDWQWGALHPVEFSHALGQVRLLDRLLNRGPYPAGGDFTTIWATGTSYHDPSERAVAAGPPFRFIADLSDLDRCLGLLCPGQSGHPGSRHYDDQVSAWFERGYHPMLFNRGDVLKHAEDTLHLVP